MEPLDLTSCPPLSFAKPDMEAFPCLKLARECAAAGGTACPAMNGANEEAVARCRRDEIGFYDIYRLISGAVERVPFIKEPSLEQVLAAAHEARLAVQQF